MGLLCGPGIHGRCPTPWTFQPMGHFECHFWSFIYNISMYVAFLYQKVPHTLNKSICVASFCHTPCSFFSKRLKTDVELPHTLNFSTYVAPMFPGHSRLLPHTLVFTTCGPPGIHGLRSIAKCPIMNLKKELLYTTYKLFGWCPDISQINISPDCFWSATYIDAFDGSIDINDEKHDEKRWKARWKAWWIAWWIAM